LGSQDTFSVSTFISAYDITKAMSSLNNGIGERFHKTILQEFYQVTLRKKIYEMIDELQNDLDEWLLY
jgi:hypothetical protein